MGSSRGKRAYRWYGVVAGAAMLGVLLLAQAGAGDVGASAPLLTPTPTSTFTPTVMNAPASTPCVVINDSITMADYMQDGMVTRTFSPSACGDFNPPCPGVEDTTKRHYKAYTFFFPRGSFSTQCITVQLTATGCPGNLYSTAYRGLFSSNDVCFGYQGGSGDVVTGTTTYSFLAFRGSYFTVVVNELTEHTGCPAYTLTLTSNVSCDNIVTPTPTPTYTPTWTPTFTPTPTNTPTGTVCPPQTPVAEGFEGGNLGQFSTSGTPGWSPVTTGAHTGTHSAFAPNLSSVTDQRLALSSPIVVPVNATSAVLSFWHQHGFDTDGTLYYDGGVLEASIDGGASWVDAGPNIILRGYNCSIAVGHFNPLAGRAGWGGYSAGYPAFNKVAVDLLPYAGHSVMFRFRLGTDHVVGAVGWWIDDVQVAISYADCPAGTPTPSPFLVGHASWQGRPTATQSPPNALPVSLTLRLQAGGPVYRYDTATDWDGYLTVPVDGVPNGNYFWRVKEAKYLATSGSVSLAGDNFTLAEMGQQAAGDANNDNVVNATDFTILKATFGKSIGDPGYDDRADFTGDRVVNASDFALLRINFGSAGAPPLGP
ncbi:MAG: dockerin type I domain-containing protein [Chloroflexia bacterium]